MTLVPSSDVGIRGHEGKAYKVNEVCAHPSCTAPAAEAHHCWPRSYLRGQPYEFVRLADGTIIGNRLGFCVRHHQMLTGEIGGHKARLVWDSGLMWWQDWANKFTGESVNLNGHEWGDRYPCDPQPPIQWTAPRHNAVHSKALEEGAICPVCGRHETVDVPRPKQERRNAKLWNVVVPDDAEIGAEILDGFIDDLAIPIGASAWSSRLKRYHVLCVVLAWVIQNRQEFIADVAEAAERRAA